MSARRGSARIGGIAVSERLLALSPGTTVSATTTSVLKQSTHAGNIFLGSGTPQTDGAATPTAQRSFTATGVGAMWSTWGGEDE